MATERTVDGLDRRPVSPISPPAPPPPPLFITGATGFVGRHVCERLVRRTYPHVRLLTRDPAQLPSGAFPAGWRVVSGDLADDDRRAELDGVETIVHLAGPTGKVRRRRYFDIITRGTKRLLDAARRAGVARFLYVSSVAAGFSHRRYYHYAAAKLEAEDLVRASGMDWLIVRPTMVLGPNSAVLQGLRKLALLPVPILFGDGSPLVQPIHVDDLAAMLVAALDVRPWGGTTITVGGPDTVTMAELLARIGAATPRGARPFRHVPLAPVRELLGALEPILFSVLPFTAGQLASFANPSRAEPSPFLAGLPTPSISLTAMLTGVASDGR